LATVALLCSLSRSFGDTLVLPPGTENTEGNTASQYPFNTFGLDTTVRRQQLFEAPLFSRFPVGITISGIAFRLEGGPPGRSFDVVIPGLEVRFSTSPMSRVALNEVFANNIGSDETVVFPRAPWGWKADWVNGLNPFSLEIPFARTFTYDPSKGNLLMDITVFGPTSTDEVDAYVELSNPHIASIFGNETFGEWSGVGHITRFTFQAVPEPKTLAPGLVGLIVLMAHRSLLQSKKSL
jgi:hypothetical protein